MKTSWYGRQGTKLIVGTLLCLPCILVGASLALQSKRTDFLNWLPRNNPATQQYLQFRRTFGQDQYVLLSWPGCTLDDERLDAFASQLSAADKQRAGARFFQRVTTGRQIVRQLAEAEIDPPPAISEISKRLQGALVGPDGKQTCAVVEFSETGERHLREAIQQVYEVATRVCRLPRTEIHMAGTPVENRAFDEQGEWGLLRLSLVCGMVCLTIAWLCLRNLRLVATVFAVAIISSLLSMALVWTMGGTLDAIQMTMPPLIYVLTLSAAIHLVNYYRDAVCQGDPALATDVAIGHGWQPCSLAALTTAVGMASLLTSRLQPVRDFGLFSALGILASLVVLFGFLPAAIARFPPPRNWSKRATASTHRLRLARRLGQGILDHHRLVSGVMIGIMLLAATGLPRVTTAIKPLKFFSAKSQIIRDYSWLEQHIGPLVPLEVVIVIDTGRSQLNFLQQLELVGAIQESLEQLPEVGGSLSLKTFLPPLPDDLAAGSGALNRQLWLKRTVISSKLQSKRSELIRTRYLAAGPAGEEGINQWRISARLCSFNDVDYGTFVADLRGRVAPLLKSHERSEDPSLVATYTGIVPLLFDSQRELASGLVRSIALAFVIIAAVMMVILRSVWAGLLAMIPNLFPVIAVYGTMGWLNCPIDLGSMLTASVAMGVAVDDTVHFLTWYSQSRRNGKDQRQATWEAYRACSRAMFQTTMIGGLGLLMFAFSDFLPMRRFGGLMFAMLAAALVGDLIALPAILVGPAGRLFRLPAAPGRRQTENI